MPTLVKYKICRLCGRFAESQCANCAGIGFVFLIFAISDIISLNTWDLGVYGILGAVFSFILMLLYCIGSCNLKEVTKNMEVIEIIK